MGSSSYQIVGYRYYMGFHMLLCHGPVDAVTQIIVGERLAWEGEVVDNARITIRKDTLFGGDSQEGGISGSADIEMGGPTQGVNAYLTKVLGPLVPAFRGVVGLVWNRGLICSNNPYPKPWAVRARRIPMKSLFGSNATVSGSANGAAIIYETLTNTEWALGYPTGVVDLASFISAATTLKTEDLGLSMMLVKEASVEEFIGIVLNHINGMLYTDRTTGKFMLKLIRGDYNPDNLPIFNTSNIIKMSNLDRPLYNELINTVVVTYRPKGTTKDDTVTAQNLASIQSQGGSVAETINYPGIDTPANANRIALRDLRSRSTPLLRAKFSVDRTMWNYSIGDVIKLEWPQHDTTVMRILKLGLGDIKTREIVVECVEDVFSLPSATYLGNQDSLWDSPYKDPVAFTGLVSEETPYWDLVVNGFASDPKDIQTTDCYQRYTLPEQDRYYSEAQLWSSRVGEGIQWVASGKHQFTTTTVEEVYPLVFLIETEGFASPELVITNRYAYLGDEIVLVVGYNDTTKIVTVTRGCLDTVPKIHPAGTTLMLVENSAIQNPNIYVTGELVATKLLMRTVDKLADYDLIPGQSITCVGRQNKPYPPGQFKINNTSYPVLAIRYFDITISWVGRNRLTQTARPILSTTDAGVTAEAGTTYRVRAYDGNTLLIDNTVSTLSSTFSLPVSYLGTSTPITFKLHTIRDGVVSYQEHEWTVVVS